MVFGRFNLREKISKALHKNDVDSIFLQLDVTSCVFGVYTPNAPARLACPFILLSAVVILSLFYVHLSFVTVNCTSTNSSTCMVNFCRNLFFFSQTSTVAILVIYQIAQKKKRRYFLEEIREIDDRLSSLGMGFVYSRLHAFKTIGMILVPFSLEILFHLVYYKGRVRLDKLPRYLYWRAMPPVHLFLLTRLPVLSMEILEAHFRHLAARLRTPPGRREVRQLVQVYDRLCDVGDHLDRTSFRLPVVISMQFVAIVLELFYLFWDLKRPLTVKSVGYTAYNFIALLFWIRMLWDVVKSSSDCSSFAQEFSSTIFDLVVKKDGSDFIESDELAFYLVMRREVKFSAYGIFPLDNTLTFSVIAAACTYLLFLVQLESSS